MPRRPDCYACDSPAPHKSTITGLSFCHKHKKLASMTPGELQLYLDTRCQTKKLKRLKAHAIPISAEGPGIKGTVHQPALMTS